MTLKSESGIATLSGGHRVGTAGAGQSALHLVGDRGWLQIDDSLFNPGRASLSSGGAPIEVLSDQRSADQYRWEIEEVGHCSRAGEIESKLVPLGLTLEVMRLVERCLAAMRPICAR